MIGIDISDRSIKVVRLNATSRKLLGYSWSNVPAGLISKGVITDLVSVEKLVGDTLNKAKIQIEKKDTVVASIPETESFLRVVQIPSMPDEEVSEVVQWEVARHIPISIDDMFIDWQWVKPAPKNATSREALVAAAKNQCVNQIWTILNALRLDVAALELESIAITRSLISEDLKQQQGLLIVDLGATETNVVIHDRGTIRFTSTIPKGMYHVLASMPENERSRIVIPPSGPTTVSVGFDSLPAPLIMNLKGLVMEVHEIISYYNGLDPKQQIKEIILTGGGSNLIGLDQAFLQQFDNVHIQRGNPWVNILPSGKNMKPPMPLNESVYYSAALGLALRKVMR